MNLTKKFVMVIIGILIYWQLFAEIESKRIQEINTLSKSEVKSEILRLENSLNNNDIYMLAELGILYHILAGKYQENVDGKNEIYLKRSLDIKRDGLVQAFFGATYLLRAKKAWNPMTKLDYVKKAFKIIDSAVDKEPDNFQIRILRIRIQLKNKKLKRYAIAKIDIDHCESIYSQNIITELEYAELLIAKADYHAVMEEKDKAKELYNKVISTYTDTFAAEMARNKLEKL